MTPSLLIAPELPLPFETVTRALALVAQRGSGKTYLSRVLAEEMVKNGLPVAIIDPLGVLYGLALTPDGQSPALPVAVLGGSHGHIPLSPDNGRAVAAFLVDTPRPIIIDLSEFRKAGQREFVTAFAEELYHRNRAPLHLIVDEADLFIPQRPQKGEERMLGAFEDVVRRGRARGLGITMITQRPAVLNKDVLTQADALVMLRLSGPQDRKAVEAWINVQADPGKAEAVLRSLPSLPVGTAWFWSPGWLGVLRKINVRQAETFDSSKTPKVGETVIRPRSLAPVDLEALRVLLGGKKLPAKKAAEKPQKLVKLKTSSTYGIINIPVVREGQKVLPEHIHPTSKFPEGAEVELVKLGRRVEELAREVSALRRFLPPQSVRDDRELTPIVREISRPPHVPSITDDAPISGVTHQGFTEMEEELYQKFKRRLLEEARTDPNVLRVFASTPQVDVLIEPRIIDLDDSTILGKVASLAGEGWFSEPRNGNQVFKELKRRGAKCSVSTPYEKCQELAELGIFTVEKDGFQIAPGARVNVRKTGT